MSVKSGRMIPVKVLASGDNIILDVLANTSVKIEAFSGHSTAAVTVTIYESTDLTSANGKIIDIQEFAAGDLLDFDKVINQAFKSDQNIIATRSGAGCEVKMSYTLYDGGDQVA